MAKQLWRMASWTVVLLLLLLRFVNVASGAETGDPTTSVQVEAARSTSTLVTSTSSSSPSASKTTASSEPSKTSSAAAQTHTISVGNGDHKFRPDVVQAEIGDTIEFDFYPQNHSVVRAEYQFPCIPYEKTGSGKQGFFSGFHPVDAVLDEPPKYTVKINDSNPIFFYCSAPGSCITYGMVGVINPNRTTSLEKQRQLAQDSSYMLQPGEDFPAESPLPSTTSLPSPSNHSSKLSAGAIAGIVIACISVLVLGSLLFFFWGRFRGLKEELLRKDSTIVRHASPRSPAFFAPNYNPQPHPSPYAESPMTSHAAPGAIPPAYFPSPSTYTAPHTPPPRLTSTASIQHRPAPSPPSRRVSSAASRRSVGGTFDLSPTTGYYTRTHDGADAYKHSAPHTSDMTSPVDPKIIPVGAYGRQMQELQRRAAAGETTRETSQDGDEGGLPPGYFESVDGRPVTFHVNRGQGPAEMDDTSVLGRGNFI